MHKNNLKHRSRLISITAILAVLFGGLITQSVRAASTNPSPVCTGTSCSVTFEYTGDYYLWSPPAGARSLSFDLMGAQGGRSGGYGGRVTGNFATTPTSIYIYVGGAGAQGSGAAGGFNGGGAAGSGRGDEGSGGGATDIRTTTAVNDRIVVAAGGGGSGGFTGGTGGNGGGTSGSAGTSGQGQGGAGATSSSGGNGGYPNGGTWGANGDFGVGGAGGSSSTSGGGGGGGGYYGGGGGGADVDSCCSNAGGGGGGSSWAHSSQTSAVTHTAAYRTGAGRAIITYSIPPNASSFAATRTLTNATSMDYSLIFTESVTGLASSDFSTTGSTATCNLLTVTGTGANYTISVSGCSAGILKLTLAANSITGGAAGPTSAITAPDVNFDHTAASVIATAPNTPSSASTLNYSFVFSEAVTGLAANDFTVTPASCSIAAPTGSGTNYTVQVSGCADASNVQLVLLLNSIQDAAGNLGPTAAPSISAVAIDRSAAEPVWSSVAATTTSSPSFEVTFAESVHGLSLSDFSLIGTATGCVPTLTEVLAGTKFNLVTSSCAPGTVKAAIAAGSYTDTLGNSGPLAQVISGETTVQAAVAAPTPTPTPTPTPAPSSSSAPVTNSEPVSNPAPVTNPVVSAPTAPEPQPTVAPRAEPLPERIFESEVKSYVLNGDAYKPLVDPEPVSAAPDQWDSQIVVNNPTAPKLISNKFDFSSIASIGLAGLAAILAAIGFVKWAAQLRSRRLVRKFS